MTRHADHARTCTTGTLQDQFLCRAVGNVADGDAANRLLFPKPCAFCTRRGVRELEPVLRVFPAATAATRPSAFADSGFADCFSVDPDAAAVHAAVVSWLAVVEGRETGLSLLFVVFSVFVHLCSSVGAVEGTQAGAERLREAKLDSSGPGPLARFKLGPLATFAFMPGLARFEFERAGRFGLERAAPGWLRMSRFRAAPWFLRDVPFLA